MQWFTVLLLGFFLISLRSYLYSLQMFFIIIIIIISFFLKKPDSAVKNWWDFIIPITFCDCMTKKMKL